MSDIPEWAKERAVELANESRTACFGSWRVEDVEHDATMSAFARYIAEHEEPSVLLIEARRIVSCNSSGRYGPSEERRIEAGERDRTEPVQIALAALKRGMELAREEKP